MFYSKIYRSRLINLVGALEVHPKNELENICVGTSVQHHKQNKVFSKKNGK
jgi:hypothetical protein